MADKDEHEGGVKVTDKRHFSADGTRRETPDATSGDRAPGATTPAAVASSDAGGPAPQPESAAPGAARAADRRPASIDFASFVSSLSTVALLYLGEIPNPETKKRETNLDYARHHIDIIWMLHDKTRGNLTDDEQHLIDSLLAELQSKYVRAAR